MAFDIRRVRANTKKVVHRQFSVPATVHFDAEDRPASVRHYRVEELAAQDALKDGFIYGQGMVEYEQLLFDLGELGGYSLSKGVEVSVELLLDAPPKRFAIQALYPREGNWQVCDVSPVGL
jgi:hypothetical protein